jgi:hypothetical protein
MRLPDTKGCPLRTIKDFWGTPTELTLGSKEEDMALPYALQQVIKHPGMYLSSERFDVAAPVFSRVSIWPATAAF